MVSVAGGTEACDGFDDDVSALLGWVHGAALRALCKRLDGDFEGLSVAARAAKRVGLLEAPAVKKLERLDEAFHAARHL